MRRASMLAGALVLTGSLSAAQTPPSTSNPRPLSESLEGAAAQAYESARLLRNNGDWSGAMAKYNQAYELARDPRLLFDMAVCARDMRRYAQMKELLLRYEREAGDLLSPPSRADVDAAIAALHDLVGSLTLAVSEPGAAVTIDQRPVGTTPLAEAIVLDLGKHAITLRKEGFQPVDQAVDIAGGDDKTVSVELSPGSRPTQRLVVVPNVAGALVTIDGKPEARDRFDGPVSAGHHEVLVTAPGKRPHAAGADLREGETRTMQITLEDERRSWGPWPWLAGGVAVVAGVVGGYFLFKHDPQPGLTGSLGTVDVSK